MKILIDHTNTSLVAWSMFSVTDMAFTFFFFFFPINLSTLNDWTLVV